MSQIDFETELAAAKARLEQIVAEKEFLTHKIQSYDAFTKEREAEDLNSWTDGLKLWHLEPRDWGWAFYIPFNTKFYQYMGEKYYEGYVPGQKYGCFDDHKFTYRMGSIGKGNFHGRIADEDVSTSFFEGERDDWQTFIHGKDAAIEVALQAHAKYQDVVVIHYREDIKDYYGEQDSWYDIRWIICSKDGRLFQGVGGYGRENSSFEEIAEHE